MRAPMSWLREHVDLPLELTGRELGELLIRAGLEVEAVDAVGSDVVGPVVVGRVVTFAEEPQKNGKVVRWVQVDVGPEHNDASGSRSVICGAHNFGVGDLVVVALPGSTLPGGFSITARKTYGHVSDGMICAEDELGLGDDHTGIIRVPSTDDAGRALQPGDDPAGVLHLRDDVLDIEVSPDMGYCLSIRGLAREAGQSLGRAFTDVIDRVTPAPVAQGHPVDLADAACPLFVAVTVNGVDPHRPSPRWMVRRLRMAGMRSISLTVDITNYVMLETGQPLHAYDAALLRGPIVVRKARAGETLTTLDGNTRQLDPDDLLITDDSGPIGLAGVMGGQSTEIRDTTTSVVIEAAHFEPHTISRTLRRHNLPSEASKRFHRGVDPNAAYSAAHRAAELLTELGGGTISADETVAGRIPAVPTQHIASDLPARILGVDVSPEQSAAILRASGVAVTSDGDTLTLTPPTWRPDLRDPYDYVEEVGRKLGFESIAPVVPRAPVGGGYTAAQTARRAINAALATMGFVEVLTFPFAASDDLDRLQVEATDPRRALVRLANPLAENQPFLRTTMLPGLFAAVTRNTSRGNDDLALYESGSVFHTVSGSVAPIPSVAQRPTDAELAAIEVALPAQPTYLGAVLAGQWRRAGWQGAAEPVSWMHALAFADTAAAAVGLTLERTAAEVAPWHPGRCAAVSVDGFVLGHAGELHPDVCRAFGLPARTCAVEMNLDELIARAPGPGSITPVSSHPVAKEDIALVVDADVPVGDVLEALREGAGALLESIALFDIYTGSQVAAGQKSVAFALRFRAPDRTLTDAETAAARRAAAARAAERCGAVLRDF